MAISNSRAVWLDYLRSFVTLLVVAHHVALAYPTFAYFDATHYIWSTAPIVDARRWLVMDTFIGFNDVFFMPLMFLISGLFVYRGLTKKGAVVYLKGRFIRLGIPFLIAEVLLIPIAYLPSFYQATHSTNLALFINDYMTTQQWPVGPPWFIWLLLAFDGIAALIFSARSAFFPSIGHWLANLSKRPFRLGVAIYCLIACSLIPLSLWVGHYTWVGQWGPFDFQVNRLFFYLSFFLTGCCLGATDWQSYLFRQGRLFGKSWLFWFVFSLISYGCVVIVSKVGDYQVNQGNLTPTQGYFLYDLVFVTSCLASVCACLSFFRQNVTKPIGSWDNLSANAYGIYVLHYGFITWLQFAFLGINLPVALKFIVIFLIACSLSWLASNLLRRNPLLSRIL